MDSGSEKIRVAIVHDWLVTYAGAERVLEQMIDAFPSARLYGVVDFVPPGERAFLRGKSPRTTFVQRLPFAEKRYRAYLPLMPLAVEQLDLSSYDLVISSSHAVAKGVLTGPDQFHICMCYSPMRYAWDLQHQYLQEANLARGPKSWVARWLLHGLRQWDTRTAHGVDEFIAISKFIERRIEKTYRRTSTVIYPPVDTGFFTPSEHARGDYYLTASRFVSYKKIGLIVDAFRELPDRRLVVVGDGPEFDAVSRRATANVDVLGYRPGHELRELMRGAKAFVFAAEEDFGISVVEAQACATPVIAYGKGGSLETVRGLDHDQPTGVLFDEQTPESLRAAILEFERRDASWDRAAIRAHAEDFGIERFQAEFRAFVDARWSAFRDRVRRNASAAAD